MKPKKRSPFFKATSWVVLATFSLSPISGYAQDLMWMPPPGARVSVSPEFNPPTLKGITILPDNPLQFDFLIDQGDKPVKAQEKEEEYRKLIKYFLASLTLPEQDLWVNLSPYEKDRLIADNFGKTEMGRDLLSQDYVLKQLTASIIYPEEEFGKTFWDKVYQLAYEKFGSTDIPVNTFNKVWIVPDEAVVYESGPTAMVLKSHLKVMLEQDYLSLKKNQANENLGTDQMSEGAVNDASKVSSEVVREIVLPQIEREVNEGKNFALLRQIYSAMILATWYKRALKESLLGKVYVDKGKVMGVDLQDKDVNQKIYEQYLEAFKKGAYNYIKEDYDKYTQETIPRKYFSGGFGAQYEQRMPDGSMRLAGLADLKVIHDGEDPAMMTLRDQYAGRVASGLSTLDRTKISLTESRAEADTVKKIAGQDGLPRTDAAMLSKPRVLKKGDEFKMTDVTGETLYMRFDGDWSAGIGIWDKTFNSFLKEFANTRIRDIERTPYIVYDRLVIEPNGEKFQAVIKELKFGKLVPIRRGVLSQLLAEQIGGANEGRFTVEPYGQQAMIDDVNSYKINGTQVVFKVQTEQGWADLTVDLKELSKRVDDDFQNSGREKRAQYGSLSVAQKVNLIAMVLYGEEIFIDESPNSAGFDQILKIRIEDMVEMPLTAAEYQRIKQLVTIVPETIRTSFTRQKPGVRVYFKEDQVADVFAKAGEAVQAAVVKNLESPRFIDAGADTGEWVDVSYDPEGWGFEPWEVPAKGMPTSMLLYQGLSDKAANKLWDIAKAVNKSQFKVEGKNVSVRAYVRHNYPNNIRQTRLLLAIEKGVPSNKQNLAAIASQVSVLVESLDLSTIYQGEPDILGDESPEDLDDAMLSSVTDIPTFIQMFDMFSIMQDPGVQNAMGELANRTYETLIAKNANPQPLLNGNESKEDRDRKLLPNLAPFDAIKDQLEVFSMRNQRALMKALAEIKPEELTQEKIAELEGQYKTRPMDILADLVAKMADRESNQSIDADLQELAKQANSAWASRQTPSRRGRPVFRPWSLLPPEEVDKDYIFLDQFLPEVLKTLQAKAAGRYSPEDREFLNGEIESMVSYAQEVLTEQRQPLTPRELNSLRKSAQIVMEIFSAKKRKGVVRPYFVHQLGVARRGLSTFRFHNPLTALINLLHHDDREDVTETFYAYRNYIRMKLAMEPNDEFRREREIQVNSLLLAVRLLSKLEGPQFAGKNEDELLLEYFQRLADPRKYYTPFENAVWYTDSLIHDTQLTKLSDILYNVGDIENLFADGRLLTLQGEELEKAKGFPAKTFGKVFMAIDNFVEPTVFLSGAEKKIFIDEIEAALNGYIQKFENSGEAYAPLVSASRDALERLSQYKSKMDFTTPGAINSARLASAQTWRNRFIDGSVQVPKVVRQQLAKVNNSDLLVMYQAYNAILYSEGRTGTNAERFAQGFPAEEQERAKNLFRVADDLSLAENQKIEQDKLEEAKFIFQALGIPWTSGEGSDAAMLNTRAMTDALTEAGLITGEVSLYRDGSAWQAQMSKTSLAEWKKNGIVNLTASLQAALKELGDLTEVSAFLPAGTGELYFQLKFGDADSAMLNAQKDIAQASARATPVGGIDFNAANLNLQIKRDGKGVPLPVSLQDLQNINIDGFIPVILDIAPVTDVPLLLSGHPETPTQLSSTN